MTRVARMSLLALVALMAACVSPRTHRQVQAANDALQKQLGDLQRVNDEQAQKLLTMTEENNTLKGRAADAAWIKDQKEKLKRLLGSLNIKPIKGVSVVETPAGNALRVKGEVLFASGKADLTAEGRSTLKQVMAHLGANRIRVEGHTDTDPIVHSAGKWKNNLELSCARATTVASFLIQSGLEARNVAAAGYGEYRPVAEGNSKEAKAKNRRVEILLLGQ